MANDVKRMFTAPVDRVGIERERPTATARLTVLVCMAALAVLVTQLPGPVEALNVLTGAAAPSAGAPLAAVQDVLLVTAGLLAWLLAGWAGLVLGVGVITRLPGRPGRRAYRLLPRIAPASVGRLVLAAVGVSLIAGTACAAPASPGATVSAATASAAPTPVPAPASGSFAIDWPATSPSPAPNSSAATPPAATSSSTASSVPTPAATAPTSTAAPSTAAPSTVAPPTAIPSPGGATASSPSGQPSAEASSASATESAGAPTASGETVTVHAGDSLWRIAADALGPDATATEVDNAWRAWYFVNREVIGDDPDVILPGQSLLAPSVEQVRP